MIVDNGSDLLIAVQGQDYGDPAAMMAAVYVDDIAVAMTGDSIQPVGPVGHKLRF